MKVIIHILLVLIFGFSWAEKGYVLIQETKGQEAHVSITSKSTVYITKNAMRIDTESVMKMDAGDLPEDIKRRMPEEIKRSTTTIQKLSKKGVEIYSIDHGKKTYIDFSQTPEFIIISFMSAFINCDRQTGKCSLNKDAIKPTDEYKTINGYKARKVLIRTSDLHPGFGSAEMVTWFTKENKNLVKAEMMKTEILLKSAMKTEFGKNNPKLIKELEKFLRENIKRYGAPIKWEMPTGEVIITSVKAKDIKTNIFDIPNGYKRVLPPF